MNSRPRGGTDHWQRAKPDQVEIQNDGSRASDALHEKVELLQSKVVRVALHSLLELLPCAVATAEAPTVPEAS